MGLAGVDGRDDLSDFGDGDRVRLSTGGATPMVYGVCDAHAVGDVGRWVGRALLAVAVANARAVAIEVSKARPASARSARNAARASGSAGKGTIPLPRHQRFRWRQAPAYICRVAGASSASMAVAIRSASPTVSKSWADVGSRNGRTGGQFHHRPLSLPCTSPREGRLGPRNRTSAEGLWRGAQTLEPFRAG